MVNDYLSLAGAAVVIGLMLYLPHKFTRRSRLIAGVVLFAGGWAGLLLGLALGDQPWLQNEAVAYGWMGTFAVAVLLGIVLFVPAALEWVRVHWPRRSRREKWPSR